MKRMTLILSLFFALNSFAGEQLFLQANSEYANDNYSTAISLYDSILTKGLESSKLYYNLGNCHYKTQDWANAIWHYEKSLQFDKNEKTLQNLELAKLKIIDRIEPLPQLFYKKWWNNLIQLLSTKTWQILALLFIWISLISKLIKQVNNSKKEYFSRFFITLALALLFITYSSFQENHTKKEAVIFTKTVIVNSAPTSNSTNLFPLHSGTKVVIIDIIGDWINIKIANGNSGWILHNSVKVL
jgi:tetratricopeptide (TPR) repeat protein